jgi:hypothetical protein
MIVRHWWLCPINPFCPKNPSLAQKSGGGVFSLFETACVNPESRGLLRGDGLAEKGQVAQQANALYLAQYHKLQEGIATMPWWQSLFGLLGSVREWFRSRPQLKIFRKTTLGTTACPATTCRTGETHVGFFTMFVVNQSADPNTVIRYDIDDVARRWVPAHPGRTRSPGITAPRPLSDVTTVDIPAHGTHEAHFCFPINAREFGNLTITVTDEHVSQYFGSCEIPNPYATQRW